MIRLLLGGNDARVVEKEISEVPVPPKLMVGTSEVRNHYCHHSELVLDLGDPKGKKEKETRITFICFRNYTIL